MTTDLAVRGNKYKNEKTERNGFKFDSKKEADRWSELQILERAGVITKLQRQVKFTLIPSQKVGNVTLHSADYYADFVYEQNGRWIVEDVKSPATKTPVYQIKKKLMLQKYGILIKEV